MLRTCIRTGREEWHVLEGFLRESTSNWISKDMSGFPGLKGNSEEQCRSMVAWEEAAPSLPQCGLFGEKMSTWVQLLLQEGLRGSHTEARQWAHFLALLPTSFSPAAQAASSFLAFLACSLLQGGLNWSFPCSHTLQGVPFSWGLGRRCIQEDPLLFLEFLPKSQAPVLLLRWSYFLTCSEEPGKTFKWWYKRH